MRGSLPPYRAYHPTEACLLIPRTLLLHPTGACLLIPCTLLLHPRLKPESQGTIEQLHKAAIRTAMVTGEQGAGPGQCGLVEREEGGAGREQVTGAAGVEGGGGTLGHRPKEAHAHAQVWPSPCGTRACTSMAISMWPPYACPPPPHTHTPSPSLTLRPPSAPRPSPPPPRPASQSARACRPGSCAPTRCSAASPAQTPPAAAAARASGSEASGRRGP